MDTDSAVERSPSPAALRSYHIVVAHAAQQTTQARRHSSAGAAVVCDRVNYHSVSVFTQHRLKYVLGNA